MKHMEEMNEHARAILRNLAKAGKQPSLIHQTLCLNEEVGEFTKEARRYMGLARSPGSFENMSAELADVVITSFVAAANESIDLVAAINAKLEEIYRRGGY